MRCPPVRPFLFSPDDADVGVFHNCCALPSTRRTFASKYRSHFVHRITGPLLLFAVDFEDDPPRGLGYVVNSIGALATQGHTRFRRDPPLLPPPVGGGVEDRNLDLRYRKRYADGFLLKNMFFLFFWMIQIVERSNNTF